MIASLELALKNPSIARAEIADIFVENPVPPNDEGNAYQVADPHESPVAFVERREVRAVPVEQRTVLVLADIHGYSYQEISEITGTNVVAVKSRLSRARLKMRDFLLEQPALTAISVPH